MPNSLHDKLRDLIYDKKNRERECRAYLKFALDILFKGLGVDIAHDVDYRGHRGDSDYIVTGRGHESGNDCVRAYVWELKAPQCFMFEEDPNSRNRLIPTKDLIQAENQLLNYYDELKYSNDFRADFNISHPSYVSIGGIIIGCDKTQVKGKISAGEKARLLQKAQRCRNLLYASENLRLMSWNTILYHLQPPTKPKKQI